MDADKKSFNEALLKIQKTNWANFGGKIRFYAPSFVYYKTEHYCSSPNAFPSISVTGSSCALKCKHCGGIVLNTMYPATTPQRLVTLCRSLKENGAVGCLISGGCSVDGSVPLGKFVDAIAQIKRELGLIIAAHTGVVSKETAEQLKKADVDAALIDIIGSDETLREIYHLDAKVADYERSLANLASVGVPFVPHVLVGLHYGKLKGELEALRMISKYAPSAVIIIAFMPIRGTVMENVTPPTPLDIGKIILLARLMMPKTPLVLGCMRPKDKHKNEIDKLAVKAGVNAIAFPAEEAIKLAVQMGYQISFSSLCCSQIYADIKQGF
ncbi:MAG: radical SAM protein [Candidatus Bathyarchaeales archaeon]